MDLSKAFDKINPELLVVKLNAYGFSKEVLELIFSNLSNRKQLRSIKLLAHGKNYAMYHKDLCWGSFFQIYI